MLAASPRSQGSWHLAGISSWEAVGQAGACKEGGSQGLSAPAPQPPTSGLSNSDSDSPWIVYHPSSYLATPATGFHLCPLGLGVREVSWCLISAQPHNVQLALPPSVVWSVLIAPFLVRARLIACLSTQHIACFLQTSNTFVEQQGVHAFSKPK